MGMRGSFKLRLIEGHEIVKGLKNDEVQAAQTPGRIIN